MQSRAFASGRAAAPRSARPLAVCRVATSKGPAMHPREEYEAVNHQERPFEADLEALQLTPEVARDLYKDMKLGRDFEDMCAQMYYRGKMFGFVHLYCGQEAVSTGVIRLLNQRDYVSRWAPGFGRPAPVVGRCAR